MSDKPKIGFILGAGAHAPYVFPTGEALIAEVATQIRKELTSVNEDIATALLSAGVSIDKFLWNNKHRKETVLPAIAHVLLRYEHHASNAVMGDWLKYVWQSMSDGPEALARFRFVTFNYDRTLEYRLVMACSALWNIDYVTACTAVNSLRIHHVYGQLGQLFDPYAEDYVQYGDVVKERLAAKDLRIIGEQDEKATDAIHNCLHDSNHIFILGCHYHPENMSLLALDKLPTISSRHIYGCCYGLTGAERGVLGDRYRSVSLFDFKADALTMLREMEPYQRIR